MKKKVNELLMFIVLCSFTIVIAIVLLVVQLNLRGQATLPFESIICTEQTCPQDFAKLSCIKTNNINGCDNHE
ncbi:MAG TPA: hypothetical protein VJK72_00710 [Candidatus Nanoarchaeia archaeon]|nr:hypothetical protein [Candidatus Nanoarchaeia archaeon]